MLYLFIWLYLHVAVIVSKCHLQEFNVLHQNISTNCFVSFHSSGARAVYGSNHLYSLCSAYLVPTYLQQKWLLSKTEMKFFWFLNLGIHPSPVSKSFRKIVLKSSIIRQFWQVRNLTDQDLGSIGKIRFEYASFVLRLVSKNNSHLKIAGPKIVIVEVVRHHIVVLREWGVVDWLPLTFWSKRRQYLPKKWGHR